MADPLSQTAYEMVCPHCGRSFRATLLARPGARQRGFKCAHCRLFVPLERVDPSSSDGAE